MPDDKDKGLSLSDQELENLGVLGAMVYGAKETFGPAIDGFLDILEVLAPLPKPPPSPPPAPRKPKARKDLRGILQTIPTVGFVGGRAVVYAQVTYQGVGSDGKLDWWPYPEKWIEVVFQGVTRQGAGPFILDLLDVASYPVKLRAVVGTGKTVQLETAAVQSYCGAMLPSDPELRDLVCALFSEGGSQSGAKVIDDRELLAVAWTFRNRYDALATAQASKHADHWRILAGRFFKGTKAGSKGFPIDRPLSYREILRSYQQFTGVDGEQYTICADPLNAQPASACRRVQKCIAIIDEVFVNRQAEDPFKNEGNPAYPGVFYYKKKGNTPPSTGALLPELTGNDAHFYQGLDEEYTP